MGQSFKGNCEPLQENHARDACGQDPSVVSAVSQDPADARPGERSLCGTAGPSRGNPSDLDMQALQ